MLKRAAAIEGGFTLKATLVSSLIIAAGLYGVALARTNVKAMEALETAVMNCIWGPSRGCRAKEIIFNLLLPGHLMAPTLYVPYNRVMWLAGVARRQLTTMYIVQAIWEQDIPITPQGPMGRALQAIQMLGWVALQGWWSWEVPDQEEEVNFVYDSPSRVGHIVRESLRSIGLRALCLRRPRQFGGTDGGPHRETLRSAIASFRGAGEPSLVAQILVGAIWTEERAHRRKKTDTPLCPYCEAEDEDEEHIFWECSHWSDVRGDLMGAVLMLAEQIEGLRGKHWRDWPTCIRMVAIVPQRLGDDKSAEGLAVLLAFTKALLSQYLCILMARGRDHRGLLRKRYGSMQG